MKHFLILPVLLTCALPAHANITEYDISQTSKYSQMSSMGAVTTSDSESACKLNDNLCWRDDKGFCARPEDNSYSAPTCREICKNHGYTAFIRSETSNEWGCACDGAATIYEWRSYSTGVLRQYNLTMNHNCTRDAVATNNYRCASGYYGTAPSGCKICPANATCSGGSTFYCNSGYYKNSNKTGCNKCPDSKEGGLGWDSAGNGIPAINGDETIEWCAIAPGTTLHDSTGTFIIDEEETVDGCEYAS